MYFQYDYGLFHENVTHLARLWLNYVHKCICEVDFDQKSSYLWVLGLTTWTFAKYCFWSFRELYKLLLFDIVSFHFCIFVFVWSEKRPKNIVWSVLVTKKSTFAHACLYAIFHKMLNVKKKNNHSVYFKLSNFLCIHFGCWTCLHCHHIQSKCMVDMSQFAKCMTTSENYCHIYHIQMVAGYKRMKQMRIHQKRSLH